MVFLGPTTSSSHWPDDSTACFRNWGRRDRVEDGDRQREQSRRPVQEQHRDGGDESVAGETESPASGGIVQVHTPTSFRFETK